MPVIINSAQKRRYEEIVVTEYCTNYVVAFMKEAIRLRFGTLVRSTMHF